MKSSNDKSYNIRKFTGMRQKFLFLLLLTISTISAQKNLYIFYPSIARPQTIQDKVEKIFQGTTVTVFGRYNDFSAKIELEPPDMVITKTLLIKQLDSYTPVLHGYRNGKSEDSYVLLSINQPVDLKNITSETLIGTIDILGRNGMNTFVSQFFPIIPKLKRVTKMEDLLPLLTFNMTTAILVQEPAVSYFKTTSNLNFNVTPLPETKDGIVALGVKNGIDPGKIIASLKSVDKEVCSFFEVDLWK
jgi:hypothetical protein